MAAAPRPPKTQQPRRSPSPHGIRRFAPPFAPIAHSTTPRCPQPSSNPPPRAPRLLATPRASNTPSRRISDTTASVTVSGRTSPLPNIASGPRSPHGREIFLSRPRPIRSFVIISLLTGNQPATPAAASSHRWTDMDAVRSLLLGGGLTVSTAAGATAQAISIPRLSPSALPSTTRCRFLRLAAAAASPPSPLPAASSSTQPRCSRWVVVMDGPPAPAGGAVVSRAEAVDYYVATLARVLGSEEEAQMSIYDASWDERYEFCCEIDEEASRELAKMPGVLAVRTVKGDGSEKDNHSSSILADNLASFSNAALNHSSSGNNGFWLVRMEKPGVEVITKAQMVDHYTQILMKVVGNEKDAQVSIYHVSWERDYGFCCHIDEECAKELADVPGVLSVLPDTNFGSDNKDYKGDDSLKSSEATQVADVKTKRLFVTGLSFYTSEKTLRAAFEPFGELIEVKIIMDKISKRSKGYAFIEYTTEEAGGAALKAMNGQIINGWMIVVDVAKTKSRDRQPPSSASGRPHQMF